MRISSIPAYQVNRIFADSTKHRIKNLEQPTPTVTSEPNFKGCNIFKVAGFIGGAIAFAVVAPAAAAIGLAGLGALPGMALGALADREVDHAAGDVDSDGWGG